jgi:hypothetical protein
MNGLPTSAVNLKAEFMAPGRAGPGARRTEASGDVGGEETIGVNHLFGASSTAAQFLLEETTAVFTSCSRSARTMSIEDS